MCLALTAHVCPFEISVSFGLQRTVTSIALKDLARFWSFPTLCTMAEMAQSRASLLLLLIVAVALPTQLQAQTPSTSAPSGPVSTTANVTGSLGYLCSSQAGIQAALQNSVANQDTAGLNVSVPTNLSNSDAVQQIAQASSWNLDFSLAQRVATNSSASTSLVCLPFALDLHVWMHT